MKLRSELCNSLTSEIRRNITQSKVLHAHIMNIHNKTDIPVDLLSDYFTLRDHIENASDYVLYHIAAEIKENIVKKHFSETEITKYEKEKFKIKKIKFPLKIAISQVTDEQWIGGTNVQFLMSLRDAQLIHYNENTQRTMEHVIRGDLEYYQIFLNPVQVKDIMEAYLTETYIPNTITLLMPEDTYYDYNDGMLYIYSIDHFDIIDGYHRYIALSNIYNMNKRFEYPMELRIVNFSESKAKQFIWQEDQKTKMRKIDSDSLNQNLGATKVVSRLNGDPTFNLSNNISRNEGIINSGNLTEAIKAIYFKDVKKKEEPVVVIEATKQLKEAINKSTAENENLLKKKWSRKFIIVYVWCCKNQCLDKVDYYMQQLSVDGNEKIFAPTKKISQVDLTRLSKL